MKVDPSEVAASSMVTLTFTYMARQPGSGFRAGMVTLTVPDGWTPPTTSASNAPGYTDTTAPCGDGVCAPAVTGMTITIRGIYLLAGQSFTIRYNDTTAPSSSATFNFSAAVTPFANATSTPPQLIPVTTCANGGTMAVRPPSVQVSTAQNFLFTYTATGCLLEGGKLTLDVPAGWSQPSNIPSDQGFVTVSQGTVTLTGSQIVVTNAKLEKGDTLTVSYAGAVANTVGLGDFHPAVASGTGVTPLTIAAAQVTVKSPPIKATMTVSPRTVTASQLSTLRFTYKPPGRLAPPEKVALTVPPGWSVPPRNAHKHGFPRASTGKVSVSGRQIIVTGARLRSPHALTITYRGTAPRSAGRAEFTAEQSPSGSTTFAPLDQSPVVTVSGQRGRNLWLTPLLAVGLGAACATAVALGVRLRQELVKPASAVTAVSRSAQPRVPAVQTTGSEPTLTLGIEPHPGPSSSETKEVSS
jgi:hypothetical protein